MMRSLLCLWLLSITACGGEEAAREAALHPESSGGGTSESGAGGTPAPQCMPAGLEAAHAVEVLRLPTGCSWSTSAALTSPQVITDADSLASAIQCTGAGAPPTVDFSSEQVHLAQFSMSPAYGGMSIMDDGAVITYVMRDRSPCPGDPMPMPMNSAFAYRMATGASRTYASASCTQHTACR